MCRTAVNKQAGVEIENFQQNLKNDTEPNEKLSGGVSIETESQDYCWVPNKIFLGGGIKKI